MAQLPKIALVAPFLETKVARQRSQRLLAMVLVLAVIGQTTLALHLLPGSSVGAQTRLTDDPVAGGSGGGTPNANPALGQSCGLDIGIVFDTSGSVDGTEMTQMKNAVKTFTTAFQGTPTEFSLSQFNTDSSVVQSFTADSTLLNQKVTSLPNAGNGNTNWDSGMARGFDTYGASFKHRLTKSDLLVVVTDGSPNRRGYPNTVSESLNWSAGLTTAVQRANTIKSAGTRIVAFGIGEDTSDPATPAEKLDKLRAISGPIVSPNNQPIGVTSDVIKTDFNQLGTAMSAFAKSLCGGKFIVQKHIDSNGDGTVDINGSTTNAALVGYQFDVDGNNSNPPAQTTSNTGYLEFSVLNGTYSVLEKNIPAGMKLTSAVCKKNGSTVGTVDLATKAVNGIAITTDDTVSCTFVNAPANGTLKVIKKVVGSTLPSSTWQLSVKHNGSHVANSPQAGSATGTSYSLNAGTYVVDETGGPSNFAKSYSGDCNSSGQVTVVAGQDKTCTVTNSITTGTLKVIKTVVGSNAPASQWQLFVKQNGTNVANTPQPGSSTGTDYTLTPGSYTVSETGPNGYTAAFSAWCPNGLAHVVAGQTTTCTITNTFVPVTNIAIVKDGPATANAGQSITYTINWSVTGNTAATNAVITDPIPVKTTFVAASNGGTLQGSTVRWNLGTKNPGDSGTVTITLRTIGFITNGTVIRNVATFDTDQNTPVSDDARTTITSLPTIDLVKSAPATVNAGDTITYTLDWSVGGTAPVSNPVITDPIPANTTFVSADNGGTFNGGVVTWVLPNSPSGNPPQMLDQGTVTVTVRTNKPLPNGLVIPNTATFDTNETAPVSSTAKTTVVAAPTIALDKNGPTSINAGDNITYTLTWSVDGNGVATNAVITDPIPANTSFVSADNGGTFSNGLVTWNLGTKNPGDTGTVTLVVKSNSPLANGTVITNIGTFDTSETAPVSDTVETRVGAVPVIAIVKDGPATVNAGGNITYTINWSVSGNSAVSDLILTDTIPANTIFVSADNGGTMANNIVTWNLGSKVPGNSGTVTMVVRANSPIANGTVVTNIATLDSNETDPVSDDAKTTVQSAPSLSITKTNNVSGFANPGQSLTYTVVVTNASTATAIAENVILTDTLPAGFSFVQGGGSTKTFQLGNIAPGTSVTTTYTVAVAANQVAGTYTNTASAQGSNTTKVTASSTVEIRVPQTFGIIAEPELTITKTVSPKSVNPGHTVSYVLTIANTGDADATNVVIKDTLPKGFTFATTGKSTETWTTSVLKAGRKLVITYDVVVSTKTKGGRYKNTATVKADDLPSKTARAFVDVKVPQVKGLATTGAGTMDYIVFIAGLILIAAGTTLIVRRRQASQSS